MSKPRRLAVMQNVLAIQRPNGRYVIQGRMVSGLLEHIKYWDGQVVSIVEPAPESELETNKDRALGGDNVEVHPSELPFEFHVVPLKSPEYRALLRGCQLGLGGIHYRTTHLARVAREVNVPFIYGTEYTLKTRLQIAQAEETKPLRLAKRTLWEINEERLNVAAIKLAQGLQCNGVPTYYEYRNYNPAPMLFFDGRITESMLIRPDVLEQRLQRLKTGQPLRLGFSGRLNKMKGGDELIEVALELRRQGVPFTLDIWGGGVLADTMRAEVARHALGEQVRMRGYVQFETLVATMQQELDVFLCCHPQGDPSGAYMEAFANGLPIVGYANEALTGLLDLKPYGLTAPIRDRAGVAQAVASLVKKPEQLAQWSRAAAAFAREHTFDKSFQRRNAHFEQVYQAFQR